VLGGSTRYQRRASWSVRVSGVLNFAFGAIAFFIARLYYYLVAQLGWPG